jgi:subtilisin family serine protease
MRIRFLLSLVLAVGLGTTQAQAAGRLIVHLAGGLSLLQADCLVAGCSVSESIDGSLGQVFLVTVPDFLDVSTVQGVLATLSGVVNVEPDLLAQTADSGYTVPPALTDNTPISYYGATVPDGYVNQPATSIVRLFDMRSAYPQATGAGVVAVIDTGVDPHHPALQGVLLPGYDFTRNQSGADETLDLALSTPPDTTGNQANWVRGDDSGHVSQSTAAVVDQSTAAVVDGNPQYSDFGHGTMVAGVIHLVAPTAKILPLKAFRSDGTGYTSDILRAIYMAIELHANVLNMSFNLAAYSQEVATALSLATLDGTIAVAAAGNSGEDTVVYPAALWDVMGVASTTNSGHLSAFSNYGPRVVWLGAPGEGIVTTYPFSTYAAAWGTSFSTPFVAGTAAVMLSVNDLCDQYGSSHSAAHAKRINQNLGNGRLDMFQAVQAWSQAWGGH